MENKAMSLKKACIVKDIQILLWGIVTVFCALLLILESIPVSKDGQITVKERITVSSALINKAQQTYTSAISGMLYNPTDDAIQVENVTVTVKGDEAGREVELDGFTLMPRTGKEIYEEWQGLDDFSRVTRIVVSVDGERTVVSNTADATAERGSVAVLLGLLAVAVILLVSAIKGRYYLWQESKL